MTRRLAIVAHFDALGGAAPHVLRQLDTLSQSFDHVIVATTSTLRDDARDALTSRAQLIERPNFGQDFASWRDGLEAASWGSGFDAVLLTNDSYVLAADSLDPMIAHMELQPVEVWGLTKSWRHTEHIQSYFLYFERVAVGSQGFRRFWADFRPAPTRQAAIMQQELGISRRMRESGLRLGSYFAPTRRERLLANRRGAHWLIQRRRAYPSKYHNYADMFQMRHWRDPEQSNRLNWASVFADFVLDELRYPVVKFDTLRYDPLWLGSDHLLQLCEERFPEQFDEVRNYLAATAAVYRPRPWENDGSVHLNMVQRAAYGYTDQSGSRRKSR